MTRSRRLLSCATLALAFVLPATPGRAQFDVELDEFFVRIEINATDGDVGAHLKLDGEGWGEMQVRGPDGAPLYDLLASDVLLDQGQTENFSESTEPLCFDEGEGEAFQTLTAFLDRFVEGMYEAEGVTTEGDSIGARFALLHQIPAAPDLSWTEGRSYKLKGRKKGRRKGRRHGVTIRWRAGDDFGECSGGEGADDGGLAPAADVDLWEVTVEPAEEDQVEDAGLPFTVFTVQVPAGHRQVSVPPEYFASYLHAGIRLFKAEVGARVGENQTFSEAEFTVRR
jgi:hypothetical protein